MVEHSIAHYAAQVKSDLPPSIFEPRTRRLGWLVLNGGLVALGTVGIAHHWGHWWGTLLFSVLIAHAFSCLGFLGHELMHGAVVRTVWLRQLLGFFCVLPFTLSPTLWVAWHNRRHHGKTGVPGVDPDAFPTEAELRANPRVRFANRLHWSRRRPFGFVTLAIGFTGQSTSVLLGSVRAGLLTKGQARRAMAETGLGVLFWAGVGFLVGPRAFLFSYLLPLVLANTVVIGYIITNHCLSPHTTTNDPLLNSLSVTVPRWLNALHLGFGFHVEHHLFPAMSAVHGEAVRDVLRAHWPERYQSLSLWEAHRRLLATPRVYAEPTVLRCPDTGKTFPTLLPSA